MNKNSYQLIILDRDGVINDDSPNYIKSPNEWHAIPGSLEAIAKLNRAHKKVAIATNQSGIARGFYDENMLEQIHQKMHDQLAIVNGHIDMIAYCPHHPNDNCLCRKPKPGLLLQISKAFNIPLTQAIMIGDSLKDCQAAQQAGCDFALVKTSNGQETLKSIQKDTISIYMDLAEVVASLIP